MPKKRKLLVLINPFSGQKKAAKNWKIAEKFFEKAFLDLDIVMTQRAGHAYDIVHSQITIDQYDGIVTVSGDGLIHEVINGIFRRPDWEELVSSLAFGFIPGGTSNGLVKSVLHTSDE